MSNPYYQPEELGLTTIAELNDNAASYDFNMVVAWKHTDGSIYWQQDSGCSCPAPFEDYHDLASLNRAAPDLRDLEEAVAAHRTHSQADADAFLNAVRGAR